MRLTIIPVDGAVYVDNYSFSRLQLEEIPPNVHALQWVDTTGHIEFTDGTPNEAIEVLPDWANRAVALWTETKAAGNTEEESSITVQVDNILSGFPRADIRSVQDILSNSYSGLIIGPRIRKTDNTIIGIAVQSVSGDTSTSGTVAMLSIRRLTEDCIDKGVPLIANANFPTLDNIQFGEYLKSLGNTEYINLGPEIMSYTPWTLSMAKQRKKEIINTDRTVSINSGVEHNGNLWDADPNSVTNILARASISNPDGVIWRTKTNSIVQMSSEEFSALASAIVSAIQSIYETSWMRKASVDAANSEDEINAI